MKKLIFISIFILFSPTILWAQDTFIDQSHIPGYQGTQNGLEPKNFDINKGEAEVKIMWGSDRLNYQLIYKTVPRRLAHYLSGSITQPMARLTTIFFLSKDGFNIAERTCHVDDFSYGQDGKTLVCRNSTEGNNSSFNIDGYRKISGVSVSINPYAS